MKNVMEYKGYQARVEYSADDECFVGRIAGINDVVGFHGTSVEEMKEAFHEAVDDYIATCEAAGKQPERTRSGKLIVRVPPDLHSRVAIIAAAGGVSINQWVEKVMADAAMAETATKELKTHTIRVTEPKSFSTEGFKMSAEKKHGRAPVHATKAKARA